MAGSILRSEESLGELDYLLSPNKLFKAVVHPRGNFVIYRADITLKDTVDHWRMLDSTDDHGHGFYLHLFAEGRISLNGPDREWVSLGCSKNPAQRSGVCSLVKDPYLSMQDDGNLVLYALAPQLTVVWASATAVPKMKLQDLTIPGVLNVLVTDAAIDFRANKRIFNESDKVVIVKDGRESVTIEAGGYVGLASAGVVSLITNIYTCDGKGSEDAEKRQNFKPQTDLIKVNYGGGGISLWGNGE